jgi:hypothetical protein
MGRNHMTRRSQGGCHLRSCSLQGRESRINHPRRVYCNLQLGRTNTAILGPRMAYSTDRHCSTVYKGLAVWHKMRPAQASRRLCLETCSSVVSVCIVSLGRTSLTSSPSESVLPPDSLRAQRPLTSGKRQEAGTMADKYREIGNVSRMAPALFDSRVSPPGPV